MNKGEWQCGCQKDKIHRYGWDGLGAVGRHEALQRKSMFNAMDGRHSRRMNVDYRHCDSGRDSRCSP